MKNLFTILAFTLLGLTAKAQDMIFKNDGTEISAKVLEISDTEVRFKKTENLDGPTYVVSVKELLMLRPAKGAVIVFKKDVQPNPPVPNPASTVVQSAQTVVPQQPMVVQQPRVEPPPTVVMVENRVNSDETCDKGAQDARVNYEGKNSGAGWVSATSILLSPLFGAIAAGVIVGTKPSYDNLNLPKPSLRQNVDYMGCYQNEAHKIKKKKVWQSFGIGTAAWALIIILANSGSN